MSLKALQLFLIVAQAASLRQAAQRLNMTPTALRRQIDSLEYYFGSELIDRNAGGISLTEAGQLLLGQAARILNDIAVTRTQIDDLKQLKRGTVRIQAGGAIVAELLVPTICTVHEQYPNLRFHVFESRASGLVEALTDGGIDLVVSLFTPETAQSFVSHSIQLRHSVIVSTDHPLACRPHVTINELACHALAIPDESFGVRRELNRAARARGVTLDPAFVTGSLVMQKEVAMRGMAALVLPPECCRREIQDGLLCAIPIQPANAISARLDLCSLPQRRKSFACQALFDALAQQMRIGFAAGALERVHEVSRA
ncbi:LysR family transcriptional regulator [Komagataeibacter europaeus]|uniref:LysR family transcriptional regulator n=1 Tax=Komagataeibacter europaeus TaxID=33995 RepID=UPI000B3E5CB6|nr:LysR family transcriptional regulator [Komagataeibacter europaeus]ARW15486.1 HTH-type transcriptional regulator CfxR [Komagataeibacter europaeus]